MTHLTDPKHAEQVYQVALDDLRWLILAWHAEVSAANLPVGDREPTSGGDVPDPTYAIQLDGRRERHADFLGQRIMQLAEAIREERARQEPVVADQVAACRNCKASPGIEGNGRCAWCGPWWREHGYDRDPVKAAERWSKVGEVRPCRQCGEGISLTEGKRTCDSCRQAKSRRNAA